MTMAENQGSIQMGSTDYKENKRHIFTEKRKRLVIKQKEKKGMKNKLIQSEEQQCHNVYQFFDSSLNKMNVR